MGKLLHKIFRRARTGFPGKLDLRGVKEMAARLAG
jgi:hypothetical protein